jgi:hypothetical protein
VNKLERISMTPNFFFISISQQRLSEDDCFHARLLNRYAFDTIRGHGAFNQRMLAQHLEPLR